MIIDPCNKRYPIQPFKLKSQITELIDGVPIASPPADLAQRNFFFGDTFHGGAHISQPCYILYRFAVERLKGWKPFTKEKLEAWVEKKEVFGKNDPDIFCGQDIWPRNKPIHLLEKIDGIYYFHHKFACELARAYWDMGRVDETNRIYFPIRPANISTEGIFSGEGSTPFCNPNIARDARIVLSTFQNIRICKTEEESKYRGGRWGAVSLEEISRVSGRRTGTESFYPEKLIDAGLLEQISWGSNEQNPEDMFVVTGKFILECFLSSPEEYFFMKEVESSPEGNSKLISAISPF